ncbi:MAG: hypothetical protein MJE66_19865 [Proteobacteria bacterium]|nr:hypothetical protein [Pseudomonadota bacterium]
MVSSGRRRFQHLFEELCVALGRVLPRYALWLSFKELGADPENLSREEALEYCDTHLAEFLQLHEVGLGPRALRRLRREVERFDPLRPTPYEVMERLSG